MKNSPPLPLDEPHGDLEPRVRELERKMAMLEKLEVQNANGENSAVVFTRENAVIRIGSQN